VSLKKEKLLLALFPLFKVSGLREWNGDDGKRDGFGLQYIPYIPKNPEHARATSSLLNPFAPNGKSGTRAHHIYTVHSIVVNPCLTNRSWMGRMPSPSSSRRRAATFMEAPKSWEKVT